MICIKTGFNLADAIMAVNEANAISGWFRRKRKAFYCDKCKCWHIKKV